MKYGKPQQFLESLFKQGVNYRWECLRLAKLEQNFKEILFYLLYLHQVFCSSMGDISTKAQHKRLSISRGHTHIGLSSASTERHVIEDYRIGDISCNN